MSSGIIITLLILAAAIILFLSERLSIDLVALLVLVALGFSRVLTPGEVFSGLSDPAVITILSIFILAHGLEVTGVADRMGDFLVRSAGGSEVRLVVTLMITGAFMSLFMNNIAVASILLPATFTIAKKANVKLSRLLMPLAFATLMGGTATLFTSTNIVVSTILQNNGYAGFGVLDFAPVGIPLILVGILYMTLWGRKMLPKEHSAERVEVRRQAESDLLGTYRVGERLFRARIPKDSFLVDKRLIDSNLREQYRLNLVAIERDGQVELAPDPDFVFQEGDVMLLEGRLEEFRQRDVEPRLEILPMHAYQEQDLESAAVMVIEVVLSPRSQLIGHTLKQSNFREKYGMTVLAVWNGERVIRTSLTDLPLTFGDALLLQGPREKLSLLRMDPDLIVLSDEKGAERMASNKRWLALVIFAATLLTAILGPFSISEVMLAGAVMMILARIMTMEQVYRAIDWRIIFLIAGMLPLGLAMTKTGVTDLFANSLTTMLQPYGPMALLLGLLTLTVLLAQAIKGAAVSAVLAPVAIQAAQQFGVDPRAMAMGVALATSLAFITPLGHPVNILMMGPGGYSFKDFFKVGLPLTILLFIVIMVLLPIVWPLHAG